MKLSEVPFDQLKVGDKLISYIGTPGHITHLVKRGETSPYLQKEKEDVIVMLWDNGNVSYQHHEDLYRVEYKGTYGIS
jgi:hypothetical protein